MTKMAMHDRRVILCVLVLLVVSMRAHAQADPLPMWNDGATKQAIVAFVQQTTTSGSPKFVPPEERIATFDQDGTLWVEQPIYSQVMYCLERVPAVVKAKPELASVEPFKTVMSGNDDAAGKPEGIHLVIVRPPHAAFGNSAGDRQMLEYTGAGDGARLMMLVLHDDAEREYAYGPAAGLPATKVGAFPQALNDQAKRNGWFVVSMKNDWKRIFAFDP